MKPFARSERVGGLIQKVLSEILQREINDPRLQMATISSVKMSSDLKIAKVYYTTPGDDRSRREIPEGFKRAAGFLKRSLARQVELRYMPELKFFLDESLDYGFQIDKLLASVKDQDGSDNRTVEK
jgi:ribosome-binding factor A